MKNLLFILLSCQLAACLPDNFKEEIGKNFKESQHMMADMNFQHAINAIELHKVRTGTYPDSLSDIQFVNAFDKAALASVEYTKLENGYILNSITHFQSMNGKKGNLIDLNYPPEFWKGLGCVQSNLMSDSTVVRLPPADSASVLPDSVK